MATSVKPIPEGYHTLTPDLIVRDGAAAIEFYKKAFDAREIYRFNGPDGKFMHAELQIGDSRLMLCEECAERGCLIPSSLQGNSSTLYLYVEDVDAAFRQALAAGAEETMAVEDMFWGDRVGQVRDPSGHRWQLATHTRDLSPEDIRKGVEAHFTAKVG